MIVDLITYENYREAFNEVLPYPLLGETGDFLNYLHEYSTRDEILENYITHHASINFKLLNPAVQLFITDKVVLTISDFIRVKKFERILFVFIISRVKKEVKSITYWLVPVVNGRPKFNKLGINDVIYLVKKNNWWKTVEYHHPLVQKLFNNAKALESFKNM